MNVKIKPINIGALEFTRRLLLARRISLRRAWLLPLYYAQLIPAIVVELLQFVLFGRAIRNTTLQHDPIFIIGHFRSGTTYLQKLLTSTGQFGYLTNYDCLFPNSNLLMKGPGKWLLQKLLTILKIKNPFFNNMPVNLDEPGEEDDYLMNKASVYSAYWGMVFPEKWEHWLTLKKWQSDDDYIQGWCNEYLKLVRYITWKHNGKQLILKSPPNTERISILIKLFPNAKFIYLHRNPIHLFYSMRNMWENAILNNYSLQTISRSTLHHIIFNYYENLITAYQRDKGQIPKTSLVEHRYEELMEAPASFIREIYDTFSIPDYDTALLKLKHALAIEKSYQTYQHKFDDKTNIEIAKRWNVPSAQ